MQSMLGELAQPRGRPTIIGYCFASLAQRAGDGLLRSWRTYWQHRTHRAAVLMLKALDDRTLADIGLNRRQIASAVYGSDGHPPRVRLSRPTRYGPV
jgi:uncharacterized protein YjiS (DUF1127 family)